MNSGAIIVDLDGTLCNIDARVHHVQGMTPDWDSFFAGIADDPINRWCGQLISMYTNAQYEIYLVSGRPDRYRDVTEKWLNLHGIPYTQLFMRKDGDHRADDIVKKEILYGSLPKDRIELVIDDREPVVKMWREEGLLCLQCNPHP